MAWQDGSSTGAGEPDTGAMVPRTRSVPPPGRRQTLARRPAMRSRSCPLPDSDKIGEGPVALHAGQ